MRRSKYGNRKVTADGMTFDSKAELSRWNRLRLMERAGEISGLRRQVRFPLFGAGNVHICDYIADFVYHRGTAESQVVEDVKGVLTETFRIKAKLMAAQGQPVTIITKDGKCRTLTNKSPKPSCTGRTR